MSPPLLVEIGRHDVEEIVGRVVNSVVNFDDVLHPLRLLV
jgi:hypothetical protein